MKVRFNQLRRVDVTNMLDVCITQVQVQQPPSPGTGWPLPVQMMQIVPGIAGACGQYDSVYRFEGSAPCCWLLLKWVPDSPDIHVKFF